MSKKVVLSFILSITPFTLLSESLLLTPPFYGIKDSKLVSKLTINSKEPTFYIIIPADIGVIIIVKKLMIFNLPINTQCH